MAPNISLRDFLIKVTNIPIAFINNHLEFYDQCDGNPFGILLDNVITYLKIIKKEEFITRFLKKYIENIDYIKKVKKQFSQKGIQESFYYITLDTFEKICMVTKSNVGESVRSYFITMRKFITYYKNDIHHMIINSNCIVYIILVNKDKNIYKIGRTCNLRKRLATYSTGKDIHPDIKFIIQVKDDKSVEECSKAVLLKYNYQKGKELYKINIDSIRTSVFNCAINVQQVDNESLKGLDAYVLFSENETVKKMSKKTSKKVSKKTSKKSSKKIFKKTLKKLSKKKLL